MNAKVFSTDSFVLASFLLCESCRLLSLDKENPRRAIFVFEETKDRQQLSELFLSHRAKVEPHRFFSAQKDLKQMLYDN
jgi:hypothetical protein